MSVESLLVRNASPYWAVEYVDKKDVGKARGSLEAPTYNWAKSLPGSATIPGKIIRKLNKIHLEDHWINKESKATITFRALTSKEADNPMFDVASGYIIYLGWWDWWCVGKMTKRVFDGVVKTVRPVYTPLGIDMTIEMVNLAANVLDRAFNPYEKEVGLDKSASLAESLDKLAKYLDVDLCLKWWSSKVQSMAEKKWAKEFVKKEQPWLVHPFKVVNGRQVPITPRDVLTEICTRYGKVWNLYDNILYIGVQKPTDVPLKTFRYRSGHDSFTPPQMFNHLSEEPFQDIEITEPSLQGTAISSGTLDPDKKTIRTRSSTMRDANSNAKIKVYNGRLNTEAIPDDVVTELQSGLRTAEAARIIAEDKAKPTRMVMNDDSITPGDSEERLRGTANRAQNNALTAKVRDALGDPHFRAGDLFYLFGVMERHQGLYQAVVVEQDYASGGVYRMSLTGVAAGDLRRQGGDLTLPSNARRMDQMAREKTTNRPAMLEVYSTDKSTITRTRTDGVNLSREVRETLK